MQAYRRMTGEQQGDSTTMRIGPYHPWLPGAMALDLRLRPANDVGPLGWSVQIASAEVELGYNYVGLEETAASDGIEWPQTLGLVERLCGCCSQANVLAYVQAVESLSQVIVPARAVYLRLVLAESERIVSHLLNAAEMVEALNLPERAAGLRDLRERVALAIADWTGERLRPGMIVYGGVARNIEEAAGRALMVGLRSLERATRQQVSAIINSREIARRLTGLSVIGAQEATIAGLRGPVLRAAGVATDIRVSFPTGAYEEEAVTIVAQRGGDAFSRLVVRLLECLESFRLIEQVLDDLPSGLIRARGGMNLREGSAVGRVEGPRGEVFCWVRGGAEGLTGLHISAGSVPTLGVLPALLANLNLEDLHAALLSFDLCLSW